MDDIVLRGMAKWPNVPAVYDWVSLDRRGNWRIKGERVLNPNVVAFIGRNYDHDDEGCWFFQNGPQRVFVALDYTPFVYRVTNAEDTPLTIESHTARAATRVTGAWLDESGTLLLQTEIGIGIVNDLDLDRACRYFVGANGHLPDDSALAELMVLLQQQRPAPLWFNVRGLNQKIEPINSGDVPQRFGFVCRPAAAAGPKP